MAQLATIEPVNILLVEDDEIDAEMVKRSLKKQNIPNSASCALRQGCPGDLAGRKQQTEDPTALSHTCRYQHAHYEWP